MSSIPPPPPTHTHTQPLSGADVEAPDENSCTPLLTAVVNGETNAFQTLLERGASIDVVDKDGRSSVFLAAKDNQIPILKVSCVHRNEANRVVDQPTSAVKPQRSTLRSTAWANRLAGIAWKKLNC